jgi:ribosomal protein L16 Arg81 hydroxylase
MEDQKRPLDALLAPISTEVFFRDHWDRQSLHIPGQGDKLSSLRFDPAALLAVIAAADRPPDTRAQYVDDAGVHAEFPVSGHDREFLNHQLQAGLTLCARDLGRHLPAVDAFSRALERQLDLAGRVVTSCYISPVGKGFGLHFDSNPVLVLQCEGSKRWRYGGTPAVLGPGHNVVASHLSDLVDFVRERPWARLHVPREQDLVESTLRPGDVLYLPAGTWHRAYADEVSTAWTFTLFQPSWFTLLSSVLRRRVDHDPAWRTFPPIGPGAAGGERWQERPETRQFIAAKLDELKQVVARLTVDDFDATTEAQTPRPVAAPSGARAPIQPGDALVAGRREDLALFVRPGEDGGDALAVFWRGDGIEVPVACAAVIERAFAARRFLAGDVIDWFEAGSRPTWSDAQALLESCVALGALSPAGDESLSVASS